MFETLLRLFGLKDHRLEDRLRAIAQQRQKLSGLTDAQLQSAAKILESLEAQVGSARSVEKRSADDNFPGR
jgi:hypothetical protein